jgi:hypothetical protein
MINRFKMLHYFESKGVVALCHILLPLQQQQRQHPINEVQPIKQMRSTKETFLGSKLSYLFVRVCVFLASRSSVINFQPNAWRTLFSVPGSNT